MGTTDFKDYYGLLGVQSSAEADDIHKAYWRKASSCHPDKGGTHEQMVQLTEAWNILSDPLKRDRYDQISKYRLNGWHSKKFDEDVLDARKNAEGYARSWADFEEIYQKAFYIFNQDYYCDNSNLNPSGPFSPFMNSKADKIKPEFGSYRDRKNSSQKTVGNTMFKYLFNTAFIIIAVIFIFFWHRDNSNIGRYVPLINNNQPPMILNTTNGAVYALEQLPGKPAYWKEIIKPQKF